MKVYTKCLLVCLLSSLFIGCDFEQQVTIDALLFKWFGKNVLLKSESVKISNLSLNPDRYENHLVVVDGVLDELSTHQTYGILVTEDSRVLVFMDSLIPSSDDIYHWNQRETIRVLGVYRLSKKGYPYVSIVSIYNS